MSHQQKWQRNRRGERGRTQMLARPQECMGSAQASSTREGTPPAQPGSAPRSCRVDRPGTTDSGRRGRLPQQSLLCPPAGRQEGIWGQELLQAGHRLPGSGLVTHTPLIAFANHGWNYVLIPQLDYIMVFPNVVQGVDLM